MGRPFLTFAHRIKRVAKTAFQKLGAPVQKLLLKFAGRKSRNGNVQLDWVKLTKFRRAWKWLVHAGDITKEGTQVIPLFYNSRRAQRNVSRYGQSYAPRRRTAAQDWFLGVNREFRRQLLTYGSFGAEVF